MVSSVTHSCSTDTNDFSTSGGECVNGTKQTNNVSLPTLVYPRDFFAPTLAGRDDDSLNALRWQYRKERPIDKSETLQPDAKKMKIEIEEMRNNLRKYVKESYFLGLKKEAKRWGMTMESTGAHPVTPGQFMTILGAMQYNPENATMVYNVFHKFHRVRQWLTIVIDCWLKKNQMTLMKEAKNGSRSYDTERGNFTIVGREAKAQAVRSFMAPLMKKQGWCVQTTRKKAPWKTFIEVNSVEGGNKHKYYIVLCKASAPSSDRSWNSSVSDSI